MATYSLYLAKHFSIRAETFGGVGYLGSSRSCYHLNEDAFEVLRYIAQHPGLSLTNLLAEVPEEFRNDVRESIVDWIAQGFVVQDVQHGGGILRPSLPTRNDILSAPLEVNVNITQQCNQRCIFCSAAHIMSQKTPEMNAEQVRQFISQLQEIGVFRIYLVGGEPVLFRWLDLLLDLACEAKLSPGLTTNGTVAGAQRYIEIAARVIDLVFSIHGPREQHDALVQHRGAYDTAWRNLLAVKSAGYDTHVSTVVMKQNEPYMPGWVENLIKVGVKSVVLLHTFPIGNMTGRYDWMLTDREFMSLKAIVEPIGAGTNTSVRAVTTHDFAYQNDWPPITELDRYLGIRCTGGRRGVTINSNGDIHPCDFLVTPRWIAGNIFSTGLKHTWDHSPVFERLRSIQAPEKCLQCDLFTRCNGGCPARAYAEHECDDLLAGWDCPLSPRFSS